MGWAGLLYLGREELDLLPDSDYYPLGPLSCRIASTTAKFPARDAGREQSEQPHHADMALSTSSAPAAKDDEARRLPAPDPCLSRRAAAAKDEEAMSLLGPVPCLPPLPHEEETKARTSARAPRRARGCLPLPSFTFRSNFPRPNGFRGFDEDPFRAAMPGRLEQLALNRKLVMDCLDFYNSKHPDDEYEPAPGVVTEYRSFVYGFYLSHGNFVARRKHSGCFSFLPAPRTIFFFELVTREDFDGVVTCIPLDEPVTEAYSFLGIHLGWRTRRDGSADCICKTCYSRCEVPRGPRKPFLCGHDRAERVCDMCHFQSCVLHPSPEEFAFGYETERPTTFRS